MAFFITNWVFLGLHRVTTRGNPLDSSRNSAPIAFRSSIPSFVSDIQPQEIPPWLSSYIAWHRQQRSRLTPGNWNTQKYLVLRCIHGADPICGGLADRLIPLPALLHLAAKSHRILFIHWDRPAPLSTWLPPRLIDWTLPAYIPVRAGPHTKAYTKWDTLVSALQKNHTSSNNHKAAPTVACVRIQTVPGKTNKTNNFDNRKLLRPVFGLLFGAPDAAVHQAATTPYLAAHIRARYGHHPIPPQKYRAVTAWAVACVQRQAPLMMNATPVMVVSDTAPVIEAAGAVPGVLPQPLFQSSSTVSKPLHLDKDVVPSVSTADGSDSVDAYASVFLDLFRLAQAKCVSYGPGGYGRLGAALAGCGIAYYEEGRYQDCAGGTIRGRPPLEEGTAGLR